MVSELSLRDPSRDKVYVSLDLETTGLDSERDYIIEVGGTDTLPQSLRAIRPGGTISMIGVLSGHEMKAQLGLIVTRQIRLQGITVGHRQGFENMCRAINRHQLKPVVDQVYPFESLPEALDRLAGGQHFGKICFGF